MQIHADDESFETYLKQFVPRTPEALRPVARGRKTRRALALAVSAATIFLTAALLVTNWAAKRSHPPVGTGNWSTPQAPDFQPLTIRTANELLERAPSLKAAMKELVLDSEEKTVPKGQSAFDAPSKENVNP